VNAPGDRLNSRIPESLDGFYVRQSSAFINMDRINRMSRDYNAEAKNHPEHRYAYDFDYLMHEYMLQTFAPFLVPGTRLS